MADVWYIGERMIEQCDGLTAEGEFVNDATLAYAATDPTGVAVSGGTGSYTYTPDSDGDYTASIAASVTDDLIENMRYLLTVTISIGGIICGTRYLYRRAVKRGGS